MFSRTTIMKALGVGALLSCFTYLFFSNNRIYVGSSDETRYWLRKHLMYWVMEANRWCDNTSLYRMLEFFLTGLAGGYFVVDMMENDIVEQKEIPLFEETSIRQNLLFPTFEEILTEIAYPIEDIPQKFRCPITHSVMNHPIFLSDGYTYDEEGVEEWLQTSNKSPMTNLPLENKTITPNHDKKSEISEFVQEKHDQYYKTIGQFFCAEVNDKSCRDDNTKIVSVIKSYVMNGPK